MEMVTFFFSLSVSLQKSDGTIVGHALRDHIISNGIKPEALEQLYDLGHLYYDIGRFVYLYSLFDDN